jgi:hypothetical protein
VDCSSNRGDAGQASPFRNAGGNLVCTISRAPNAVPVAINGAAYYQIGPDSLFPDPAPPVSDPNSRYELTIVATLRDNTTGALFEFSFDPEMDVNN